MSDVIQAINGHTAALTPKPNGRIATLESKIVELRTELDQTRWCFMEFLYGLHVAARVAEAQRLLSDPAVMAALGQGAKGT